METWRFGTWFSGGLGSVRLAVGLNDLKGLLQPKRFCDSLILPGCSWAAATLNLIHIFFFFPLNYGHTVG